MPRPAFSEKMFDGDNNYPRKDCKMELAYLIVSVAGMFVAVSVSIRQEKKRERDLAQCLNELACFAQQGVRPEKDGHPVG